MKTLLFLRHAQAEASAAHDRDRTLTEAGRDAARRVGRFIGMVGPTPDLIFTSTAVRARETLACAREEGHWSAPIHAADGFYETAPRKLLEDIQFAPEPAATLLLIGHEPTWRTIWLSPQAHWRGWISTCPRGQTFLSDAAGYDGSCRPTCLPAFWRAAGDLRNRPLN
jgi:phosphohistidine phosphatase SixA